MESWGICVQLRLLGGGGGVEGATHTEELMETLTALLLCPHASTLLTLKLAPPPPHCTLMAAPLASLASTLTFCGRTKYEVTCIIPVGGVMSQSSIVSFVEQSKLENTQFAPTGGLGILPEWKQIQAYQQNVVCMCYS